MTFEPDFEPDTRFEASRRCPRCGGVDEHRPDCAVYGRQSRLVRPMAWLALFGIGAGLVWSGGAGALVGLLLVVIVVLAVAIRRALGTARRDRS